MIVNRKIWWVVNFSMSEVGNWQLNLSQLVIQVIRCWVAGVTLLIRCPNDGLSNVYDAQPASRGNSLHRRDEIGALIIVPGQFHLAKFKLVCNLIAIISNLPLSLAWLYFPSFIIISQSKMVFTFNLLLWMKIIVRVLMIYLNTKCIGF